MKKNNEGKNKNRRKKSNDQRKKILKWDFIKLIPIIMFAGILPLIVRLKIVEVKGLDFVWLPDPFVYSDIFNYHKAEFLWMSALVAILFMIIGWVMKKFELKYARYDIFLMLFLVTVVISSLITSYKSTALLGYADRWHGVLTWLSYGVLYLYTKSVIDSEKDKIIALRILLISGLLMGLIGLTQFMGIDVFKLDFFKQLMIPLQYRSMVNLDDVKFVFEANRVYMTLYNPNNIGVYVAGMLPISLVGYKSENGFWKTLWILLAVLLLIALYGSYSRAGLVATVLAATIYAVLNLKRVKAYSRQILVGIVVVILLAGVSEVVMDHSLTERLLNLAVSKDAVQGIQDISINSNKLELMYDNEILVFEYPLTEELTVGTVKYADQTNTNIVLGENGYNSFENDALKGLSFGYGQLEQGRLYLEIKQVNANLSFIFVMMEDGFKYLNGYGELVELGDVEQLGFDKYQMIGSNRGYIWSRSIPLISDNLLMGSGPDSFVYMFPQTDYIKKQVYYRDNPDQVVDKPHNQYIGWAVEYGLVGLVLVLLWLGSIIKKSYKQLAAVSTISILLTFMFYDISINTGWLLFFGLAMVCVSIENCHEIDTMD